MKPMMDLLRLGIDRLVEQSKQPPPRRHKRDISRDRGVGGSDKRREEYVTYRNDGKKISIATH
jgi:hypothetical protein